jgi:hypothetical protein
MAVAKAPENHRRELCLIVVRRTIIERIAIQEISESQIFNAARALQKFQAWPVTY